MSQSYMDLVAAKVPELSFIHDSTEAGIPINDLTKFYLDIAADEAKRFNADPACYLQETLDSYDIVLWDKRSEPLLPSKNKNVYEEVYNNSSTGSSYRKVIVRIMKKDFEK